LFSPAQALDSIARGRPVRQPACPAGAL